MPSLDARPVAILLAAGGGRRFQGTTHKLLAPLIGPGGARCSVVEHALRAVIASDIGPVVVVSGAVDLSPTLARVTADDVGRSITAIEHDGWAAGQATSLAVGVRAAIDLGATSVVVGLGDQPGITPDAWRRVASAASPIAVATYDDRRGNPVRLASDVWPLLPTEGDEGARSLMHLHPDLVGEVACDGSAFDIDTLEDLARWQNS
ncbi:MAG: nucleotidyltransferase family protein [Actinomycetota bacterium]